MSITTSTTVAPLIVAATPFNGPDVLAEAIYAVDNATDRAESASATLKAVVLARFALHADYVAGSSTVDGVRVLPVNYKRIVQAMVWRDGTGTDTPPAAADRSKGETAVGVYLSMFTRVATNGAHGIPALESTATVTAAIDAIKADESASRERVALIEADKDARALAAWIKSLPPVAREAFAIVTAALTDSSVGQSHAAAFVATIPLPSK